MSDEIWESSQLEKAIPATKTITDVSNKISSIQRSLVQIDAKPTSRDMMAQVILELTTTSAGPTPSLPALEQQYAQWMREEGVVSDTLWFQVAEIGARLASLGNASALQSFATTALRPASMPHKEAFCDVQRQVRFSIQLFDALCGSTMTSLSSPTAMQVVESFVAWIVCAMSDYEFVFLHHIAQPLVTHIQQTHRVLPDVLAHAAQTFVETRLTPNWEREVSSIAVASLLLSASTQGTATKSIQSLVMEKLQSSEVFPHVHRSVAVLAVPLQASPLAHASSPVLHQFILLRVVHLTLVSCRLMISQDDFKRLSERYQESLYRSQLTDREVVMGLRMIDASTDEIKAAMDATPAITSSILQTMRSRSENELFEPSLIDFTTEIEKQVDQSQPQFPAMEFLAKVYDAVTVSIVALAQSPSTNVVLHCSSTLCRLEFARECCASPQRNAVMVQLTQRIEGLIESAPDATLTAITSSVLQHQQSASLDRDVVFGWACLAVGLIVQRKLRVVLFQASPETRRNALAVVFGGLYHGLQPVNSFAHRFIGFALSSLGQFVSVYELVPFYLQETLRRFPTDVPKEKAASVLGTIFGALYYTTPTHVLTEEEKKIEATAQETRHAMILWALRQCSQRAKAMLRVDGDADSAKSGLYVAELFLEVAKMAPVELLPTVAEEMEELVHYSSEISEALLHEVKMRVLNAISLNCEAEKRAWLAAWYLDLSAAYPSSPTVKDLVNDAQGLDGSVATVPSQIGSRL